MQGRVSGDPRVFARRNYQSLRHPTPELEIPNIGQQHAAFMANASYSYLNEGAVAAKEYLASE